jgi:peptidoglycan/LPS O-acetylase OafA/YrhL
MTPSSDRDSRSRLAGIEGMRALAASSVLVYHVWLYGAPDGHSVDLGLLTKVFDNLRAGVTLFFVLSGFLLFRPYVAAALRGGATPSLRAYLRNRALRILPAYWFILLFVALALEHTLVHRPQQLLANAGFAQDYVPSYIYGSGIVPAWSLAIEVVFYLCVPVLGGAAILLARRGRLGPVKSAFVPVAVMVAVGFSAKAASRIFGFGQVWELSFLMHADWFSAGMALAVVRVLWEDGKAELRRWWLLAALSASLVLTAVSIKLYYAGTLTYVEYQTPIAVSCALLLGLVVLTHERGRINALLSSKPMVAAGLCSYSVFLWHDPLLRWFRSEGVTVAGPMGLAVNVLLLAVVAGVASAFTYRFVEKPALRRKRSWQQGGVPSTAAEPMGSLTEAGLQAARAPASAA